MDTMVSQVGLKTTSLPLFLNYCLFNDFSLFERKCPAKFFIFADGLDWIDLQDGGPVQSRPGAGAGAA